MASDQPRGGHLNAQCGGGVCKRRSCPWGATEVLTDGRGFERGGGLAERTFQMRKGAGVGKLGLAWGLGVSVEGKG